MKRKHLSLEVRLAAALIKAMGIPHEHAKLMTAKQINSLVEWHHHPIPKAVGGKDEPWNLQPEFKARHREVTRKETVPGIYKERRIKEKWSAFTRLMARKEAAEKIPAKPHRWPSRPFPKRRKAQ